MISKSPAAETAQKELPTLSLFDYLGRRAGEALGAAVYEVAKMAKEPVKLRMLDLQNYKGKVMVYRPSFLKAVFNEPILKKIIDEDVIKYNKKMGIKVKTLPNLELPFNKK